MSAKLDSAVRRTVQGAVDIAWAQWRALGPVAGAGPAARAIVDPEALILLSLALREDERRLVRTLAWWARTGSRLLSVQRLKNLARTFPASTHSGIAEFAQTALTSGDARWRSLAGATERALIARDKDLTALPTPDHPAALILRLRMAFSVGIKADVLGYFLGHSGARATISATARATAYYPRAVRRGVEDLAAAGFLQASVTTPVSYNADPDAWRYLLRWDPDPPPWRPWSSVFAFIADLKDWLSRVRDQSDYVISSRARDLTIRHRSRLEPDIRLPDPQSAVGAQYTHAFLEELAAVREWMEAVV